jgi:hypothetical protein
MDCIRAMCVLCVQKDLCWFRVTSRLRRMSSLPSCTGLFDTYVARMYGENRETKDVIKFTFWALDKPPSFRNTSSMSRSR